LLDADTGAPKNEWLLGSLERVNSDSLEGDEREKEKKRLQVELLSRLFNERNKQKLRVSERTCLGEREEKKRGRA
jgi:hypothetical protein